MNDEQKQLLVAILTLLASLLIPRSTFGNKRLERPFKMAIYLVCLFLILELLRGCIGLENQTASVADVLSLTPSQSEISRPIPTQVVETPSTLAPSPKPTPAPSPQSYCSMSAPPATVYNVPETKEKVHEVNEGEYLSKIAEMYNIPLIALIEANLKLHPYLNEPMNWHCLWPDQKLIIPDPASDK